MIDQEKKTEMMKKLCRGKAWKAIPENQKKNVRTVMDNLFNGESVIEMGGVKIKRTRRSDVGHYRFRIGKDYRLLLELDGGEVAQAELLSRGSLERRIYQL